MSESQIHTDVACTVCGCVCDDLEIHSVGGRITEARDACGLAEPWFFALNDRPQPAAEIEGIESTLDSAIDRAKQILRESRNPLIFGLSRSSTDGQQAAVALADILRANIDTTASVCHGPSIMAIQEVGESTCTLGEVRNRADLVIFWGADPVKSHPRHFERYSVDPVGQFVPRGRADRTVVVIDAKQTATSELADIFLQPRRGADFEVIWMLRQLIRGVTPSATTNATTVTGVAIDELRDLAERMKTCRYGVVFFGLGLAQRGLGHATVAALLRLVDELNAHARFCARRLRIPGDVSGADSVLCWRTGYPFAVNMNRGYPRYNPGEYSANELLARGEVDACLLVGSESTAELSNSAKEQLRSIRTIVFDYPHMQTPWTPTVRITTAVHGVHAPGTAYRMDEVPIPLRKLFDAPYPTDAEVLGRLNKKSTTAACVARVLE